MAKLELEDLTKAEWDTLSDALNSRIGILRKALQSVNDPQVRIMYYQEIDRVGMLYDKVVRKCGTKAKT